MDMNAFKSNFFELVEKVDDILITSHKNPDPDSFGSVLSMINLLKEKYPQKNILGLYTGDLVDTWSDMPNADLITSVKDVAEELDKFDLLIALDVHPYDRFLDNLEKASKFKGKTVCIDHHGLSTEVNYDLFYNDPKATSVAELIYRIFLEDAESINPNLCESILMGLLGDTMWLTVNIRADTVYIFDIVKKLVLLGGINLEVLRYKTFLHDRKMFPAQQILIANAKIMKIGEWPEMVVGFISRESILEKQIPEINVKSASNNFVNSYSKMFAGITWGLSAYPLDNGGVSISMRSLAGSTNVREIALTFGGGGHDGASSMKFRSENGESLEPEECLKQVIEWMENNKPVLRV